MSAISDQDIYDRYAERAAIMQHDGGLSLEKASQFVFNQVAAWCKAQGRKVPQSIRDDYRRVIDGTHPT